MRIITWNCNMAFRKKAAAILAYKPDILIVPECENVDKLAFPLGTLKPMNALWFGTNPSKGIGIFSYNNFSLKTLDCHNEQLRHIIPIAVVGGSFNFNLFAIWTNNSGDSDGRYVEQIGKAIHHYEDLLLSTKTILIGDFNSNSIWDKEHKVYSHSTIVRLLEKKGISSTYHLHYCQIQV
jgi:exodeoxyribonuclease III